MDQSFSTLHGCDVRHKYECIYQQITQVGRMWPTGNWAPYHQKYVHVILMETISNVCECIRRCILAYVYVSVEACLVGSRDAQLVRSKLSIPSSPHLLLTQRCTKYQATPHPKASTPDHKTTPPPCSYTLSKVHTLCLPLAGPCGTRVGLKAS